MISGCAPEVLNGDVDGADEIVPGEAVPVVDVDAEGLVLVAVAEMVQSENMF